MVLSSNYKIPIILGIITIIVLVGGVFLMPANTKEQISENPQAKAYLDHDYYDWGNIDINGPHIQHEFVVKNEGSAELEIANVETSCMCTTAYVVVGDLKSPPFGMHARSAWKGKVKPGDEAKIIVDFDPLYHGPQAIGPIERLISFNTNDPENSSVELKLNGNVFSNK